MAVVIDNRVAVHGQACNTLDANVRFYVVNESRVVKADQLYADSDGDGVSDVDEIAQDTDPTNPDSKDNGCSDRVQELTKTSSTSCSATCGGGAVASDPTPLVDSDGDTLLDCDEAALGTQRAKADTNGYGFIDSLGVRFGTVQLKNNPFSTDTDADGVDNGNEMLSGTDPLTAQSNRSLAFVYEPVSVTPSSVAAEQCFQFAASNIQLVQTLATSTSQAGDNRICVYIEQLSSLISNQPSLVRACFTVNYQVTNGVVSKSPQNGAVSLTSSDFQPFICNGGICH